MTSDRDGEGEQRAARTPEAVLRDPGLTREQKIEALRQLAYDARELDVATDEGMGGEPSNIGRIHAALKKLGVSDAGTDAKQ